MSRWFHENQDPCRRFGDDENPPTARQNSFTKAVVVEHETVSADGEPLPTKIVVPTKKPEPYQTGIPKAEAFTEVVMTTKKLVADVPTETLPTKKRGRKPKITSWTATVTPTADNPFVAAGERYTPGPISPMKKRVRPKLTTKTPTTETLTTKTTKTLTTKTGGRPKLTDVERAERRKASFAKYNKSRKGK